MKRRKESECAGELQSKHPLLLQVRRKKVGLLLGETEKESSKGERKESSVDCGTAKTHKQMGELCKG